MYSCNTTPGSRRSSLGQISRPLTSHRPATGLISISRPTTARPQTAASTRGGEGGSFVIAIIEGRSVGREVGLAALNKDTGQAFLIQLADCQTYVKTVHHVHLHYPTVILVPDTFLPMDNVSNGRKPSLLVQILQDEFEDVPFEAISRKYWNDSAGLEFISQLIIDDEERPGTLLSVSNKYYTLSAASALFKFVHVKLNTIFAHHSLRISYRGVEGTMMIDTNTATNLELVGSTASRRSNQSLFGLLNHTFTPMATRLLRVSILAPCTLQATLDARLDAVEELIQTEEKYTSIKEALRSLKRIDVDKLITALTTSESKAVNTAQVAAARVSQVLNLRSVVQSLPVLHLAVQDCRSPLMKLIESMVSDERIGRINAMISETLNEEVAFAKAGGGGGLAAVNAKVYAVKANYDRLLDVARETYKENVGDIFKLTREMSNELDIHITPTYQEKGGGFWLTIRKDDIQGDRGDLPESFLNITSKGTKWQFTTLELKKRNSRMKDSLDETLLMSYRIIQNLVSSIIGDVGVLYKSSEAIALVDMLWSFSHVAILHNYVRPEFTGTLAIKGGRHPVMENLQVSGTFVPNDTFASDASTFQLIQGPNMSGKSTYLRQIGVMTVMALCGSFVSAEYGSFRLHDCLLSRLSNDDDPERSLSTFSNEMSSSAMILSLATSQSLILIDELGRGTSPHEGIGISHAIAEALVQLKAFSFFATHYSDLTTTLSRSPNVVNLHLAVQKNSKRINGLGISFRYKILDGSSESIEHYGLELARLADLPNDMLSVAKNVSERLTQMELERRKASKSTQFDARRKAMLTLKTRLTQTLDHSTLPDEALASFLLRLQSDLVDILNTGGEGPSSK